ADPRFSVLIGGSKAKTIAGINQKRKPLDDVRVRRAILAAVDRKAMIDGAVDGFGAPIGSFYTPGSIGYVDTTGINPYDPDKAKGVCKGVLQFEYDFSAAACEVWLPRGMRRRSAKSCRSLSRPSLLPCSGLRRPGFPHRGCRPLSIATREGGRQIARRSLEQ